MRTLAVMAALAIAVSGCGREPTLADWQAACAERGFRPGSAALERCVQQESLAYEASQTATARAVAARAARVR